jgi:predicted ATP-binding protein involved in virulence
LNPNAFETLGQIPGIVLIDELDMHLHPKWQWNVIKALKETFPKIQFIIATHSPFMLGTLNAKIYNLDAREYEVTPWYKLENVRYFYDFFKKHEKEFND